MGHNMRAPQTNMEQINNKCCICVVHPVINAMRTTLAHTTLPHHWFILICILWMKENLCMDISLLESTWAEAKLVNYYIRKRKGSHYVGNCWIIFHLLQELKKKTTQRFGMLWSQETFCGYIVHLAKGSISLEISTTAYLSFNWIINPNLWG